MNIDEILSLGISDDERVYAFWLHSVPWIGQGPVPAILDHFGSPKEAFLASDEEIRSVAGKRSDLRDLEREGAIVRYHGGARISDSVKQSSNPENYMLRSVMSVAEKTAIGREAGKFVHEGETIFIDASSTTFHMIPFISNLDNLTIVTNGSVPFWSAAFSVRTPVR